MKMSAHAVFFCALKSQDSIKKKWKWNHKNQILDTPDAPTVHSSHVSVY